MSTPALSVRQERFPHLRQYRIADYTLQVKADCVAAVQLWQSFAQRYCLIECPQTTDEQLAGTIELYWLCDAPTLPPLSEGEAVTHGYYWSAGESVWLDIAGAIIYISPPPLNRVQVWLPDEANQIASDWDWVMSYALPSVLRRHGFYELHAAGLIAPATTQGILLIGDPGSGKSTLTTQLANSGWSYLSDDLLLLQATNNAVSAWGLRRVFALTQQTINACLPAQACENFNANAAKYLLAPDKMFAATAAANCQPSALFFTELTHQAQTRVEPISRSEAMLGLLRQSSWLCYDPHVAAAHTQALTRLTQQCQAFRLYAGQDLLLHPNYADTLLRSYLL